MSVQRHLAHVAVVVRDYDEAIDYFTRVLDFDLVEDTFQPQQNKRWVLVRPKGSDGASVLLARPSNEDQTRYIGNQTGGRVSFFLHTDDFWRDFRLYQARGVKFVRQPERADHGTVAVFEDLYGNLWDLIEPVPPEPGARIAADMFDHVKFGVRDLVASKRFYLAALESIGVTVATDWPPDGVELSQPGGSSSLCLFTTEEKPAHLHIAFVAESRDQVDAFHAAALAAGGVDHGAPGLRPEYSGSYYAAFVLDPDGHNIEVVCHDDEQ